MKHGASSRRMPCLLGIVVPCHNEEEVLATTVSTLRELLTELRAARLVSQDSYVCFVDDGSLDATWAEIERAIDTFDDVQGLKLARNFGHQSAILAGMFECDADVIVTIDADLQDDERSIVDMIRRYHEGFDVVLGVRSDRSSDTVFKRLTAELYYRLLHLVGVKVVFNHADYRLLSRSALENLKSFPETNLFLRGLIPLVGLETTIVQYARRERLAGESKYPLRKMLALAWEGVTSFSVTPLRLVAALGAVISFGALLVTAWALWQRLIAANAVPGWASTVVPMYFLGGVQILCLGVIGEYIGKIYLETKKRPRYLIASHVNAKVRPRQAEPLKASEASVEGLG